jgi:hypothetical protein
MRPEVISIAALRKNVGLPTARFSNTNAQVDYAGIGYSVHSFKPGGGMQRMSGKFHNISLAIIMVAVDTDDFIYKKHNRQTIFVAIPDIIILQLSSIPSRLYNRNFYGYSSRVWIGRGFNDQGWKVQRRYQR